jgi:hypothetical protein
MSNRDRIARLRDEADATAREREAAQSARREREPSPRRPAAAAPPSRVKVVWAVKDGAGAIVATFPYPDRKAAEKEALRRSEGGRHTFLVAPHKVPFDG